MEKLAAAVLEALPEPALILDSDGHVLHANAAGSRAFGVEANGSRQSLPELLGEEAAAVDAALARLRQSGETQHGTMQPGGGRPLSLCFSLSALRGTDGLALLLLETIEVAERARADAQARADAEAVTRAFDESQAIYRAICESIPFGVWASGPEGELSYLSESMLEMLGRQMEQCEGCGWLESLVPEERERAISEWKRCVSVGGSWDYELRIPGADGREHYVLSRGLPVRDAQGSISGWAGINLDITDRKQLEREKTAALARERQARAEAEQARRRLELLAETSALLGSFVESEEPLQRIARLLVPELADWVTIHLNDSAGAPRLAGAAHRSPQSEAILRGDLPALTTGLDRIAALVADGKPALVEDPVTFLGRGTAPGPSPEGDSTLRPARVMLVPLVVAGRALGVITLARLERDAPFRSQDLTLAEDLGRRAALALEKARLFKEARDAVSVREELISIASHELRTPLASLQLLVQSTLRAVRRDPSLLDLQRLERTERQVERLGRLINHLLDATRITAGKLDLVLEPVDLCAIAREVSARLTEDLSRAGCVLTLRSEGRVEGHWDRMRLDQVLTNLLTNAMKYGAGGPVELTVEGSRESARLTVRDRGIGIAPEDQSRIFERYHRAAPSHCSGLGLGLWISHEIAAALGGRLAVESRLGEGSTFTLELPLRGPALAPRSSAPEAAPPELRTAGPRRTATD